MQQQGEREGEGEGEESRWHNNNNNNKDMRMGVGENETSSHELVEAASPISSRPPQTQLLADNNELMPADLGNNRWPRQETLALLKIRSDMDATFRDATLKAPLWDHVSRKLAEVGYKRSAKKCKEKFENVHKYYKRTKEGRGGRQDGKTYKFFSELEALQAGGASPAASLDHGITNNNPMPISSFRSSPNIAFAPTTCAPNPINTSPTPDPPLSTAAPPISFSSSSSTDDDDVDQLDSCSKSRRRKRKRSSDDSWSGSMMEFFESLMRQVMQKQEAMQQRFLELIEKGEEERMIREEAWKRQEISRLTREQQLMAQERAISASRDAAIVSFLHKITGQTIHLPHSHALNNPPLPPQATVSVDVQPQEHLVITTTSQYAVASASSSSRWPKAEVLGLIKVRSEMECRYQQDAVPKGPLWEEVSAKMHEMGYMRSAKRCKEKWENINKYFKKVKESSKKRPEDANTCPYFHQLDALYRNKQLGTGTGTSSLSLYNNQNNTTSREMVQPVTENNKQHVAESSRQSEKTISADKQPEDIVKELRHDEALALAVAVDDYQGVKNMGLENLLQREGQKMTSNSNDHHTHAHTSSAFLAIVQ